MGFTVKEQENFHTRLEEPAGLPLPLLSKWHPMSGQLKAFLSSSFEVKPSPTCIQKRCVNMKKTASLHISFISWIVL